MLCPRSAAALSICMATRCEILRVSCMTPFLYALAVSTVLANEHVGSTSSEKNHSGGRVRYT